MVKYEVEAFSFNKSGKRIVRKEIIDTSENKMFSENDSQSTIKRKYESYWNMDKYEPPVRVLNVRQIYEPKQNMQHRPSKLNVERPSILGNSSFGFNTQSRSKRPNILNMSVPNILRKR